MSKMKKKIVGGWESLRAARDLMNHGGRHWVKGTEEIRINPDTHIPGSSGEVCYGDEFTEWGYCSIGALKKVGVSVIGDTDVILTLADVMDPVAMDERRTDARAWEAGRIAMGCIPWSTQEFEHQMLAEARDVIMAFNDDQSTTWDDVHNAFTKAAKRLKQRMGS